MKSVFTEISFRFLLLSAFLSLPATSHAQMFSADSDKSKAQNLQPPSRGLYFGPSFTEFTSSSGSGDLSFDGQLATIGFSSSGLTVEGNFGNSSWNPQEVSLFHVGAELGGGIRLLRSGSFALVAPAGISSDYLRASKDGSERDFQQSSFRVAGGLGFSIFTDRLRIQVAAKPSIGFSYSQGSLFGGNVRGVEADVLLGSVRIHSRFSLSSFYSYKRLSYDIDGVIYDYDLDSHRAGLMVLF